MLVLVVSLVAVLDIFLRSISTSCDFRRSTCLQSQKHSVIRKSCFFSNANRWTWFDEQVKRHQLLLALFCFS